MPQTFGSQFAILFGCDKVETWKQGDKVEAKRLLAEAQTAMDAEMKASPLWDCRATLELFRREAEALIQTDGSSHAPAT